METVEEDIAGTIWSTPVCSSCGSERVVTDAWACWNPRSGLWELEASFDQAYWSWSSPGFVDSYGLDISSRPRASSS